MSIGATTRSTGAFTTLTSNGATTFTLATDNTLGTTASGAVQLSGGLGVALNTTIGGDLRIKGGDLTIEGTPNIQAITAVSAIGLFDTTTGTITLGATTSTLTARAQTISLSTAGVSKYVSVLADDTSTSTTSGSLRVAGGVGIAKSLYIGGDISASGTANTTINQTGNVSVISTGNVSLNNTGNISISPTTSGTVTVSSITTGSINNMSIGATTRSTGAFTTLTSNGATTFTAGTNSTSYTTGTLVVTGGVGISQDVFINGDVAIAGGDLSTTAALFNLGNTSTTGSYTTVIVPGVSTAGTRTINIGSAGSTGSTTTINVGPATLGTNNVNIGGNVGRTAIKWGSSASQWSTTDIPGVGFLSSDNTILYSVDSNGKLDIKVNLNVPLNLTATQDLYVNGTTTLGDAVGDNVVIGTNQVITTAQPVPNAATVGNIVLASFASATYRSCEFLIQGVGSTTTNAVMTKVYAVHDGAGNVDNTEFGRVVIGNTLVDEGGFTVDYNAGNIRLLVNQALANTVWKITMNLIKA
jgi:hypothetical protein